MLVLCFSIICEAEGSNIPQHISRELAIIFNSTKIRFFVMRLNFSFACAFVFWEPLDPVLGQALGPGMCTNTNMCTYLPIVLHRLVVCLWYTEFHRKRKPPIHMNKKLC